jgi:NAD(P)-dependent dehydrogenase (short-subunit alcohol dehydrogenase family)
MDTAVITGVSSGIGLGIARVLSQHGWLVFGSVRKRADGERVQRELGERFVPLEFDVTDGAAVSRAADLVRERLHRQTLSGLVNNAGVAVPGPLLHQPIEDFQQQLDINVVGVLRVIQAFAPLLGADPALSGRSGRIVNISSVGGRLAPPFLGAYAASKHAIEGLSESLRRELMLYGIDVVIVGPGAVATPIWDKAQEVDLAPYAHTDYVESMKTFREAALKDGRAGFPPERVGDVVLRALTVARPRVRYAVVPKSLINWTLPRLLPRRWIDRLIASRLHMKGATRR